MWKVIITLVALSGNGQLSTDVKFDTVRHEDTCRRMQKELGGSDRITFPGRSEIAAAASVKVHCVFDGTLVAKGVPGRRYPAEVYDYNAQIDAHRDEFRPRVRDYLR